MVLQHVERLLVRRVYRSFKTDSVAYGLGWLSRHYCSTWVAASMKWLLLDPGKHEVFVHGRFAEFLLYLRLEDVQLVLHVPIDVREALLGCVVVRMLTLFVGEGGDHALVVLLDLGSRILATFIGGW